MEVLDSPMYDISPMTMSHSLCQLSKKIFSQLFSNPYPTFGAGINIIQQISPGGVLHYQINFLFRVKGFIQLNLEMKSRMIRKKKRLKKWDIIGKKTKKS